MSTTQVQITVTKDQPAYVGEFTRISELDPDSVPLRRLWGTPSPEAEGVGDGGW